MLKTLLKIANQLDQKGFYTEADQVDIILTKIASKNSLIKALKEDDAETAYKSLTGLSGKDLGLDHKEFNRLVKEIEWAAINPDHNPDAKGNPQTLDKARKILGVGKNTKMDPDKINPFTNKPWPSDPQHYGDLSHHPKPSFSKDEEIILNTLVGTTDLRKLSYEAIADLYNELKIVNKKSSIDLTPLIERVLELARDYWVRG